MHLVETMRENERLKRRLGEVHRWYVAAVCQVGEIVETLERGAVTGWDGHSRACGKEVAAAARSWLERHRCNGQLGLSLAQLTESIPGAANEPGAELKRIIREITGDFKPKGKNDDETKPD